MEELLKQCVAGFDRDAELLSDTIWGYAEMRYQEKQSCKLQEDYLEAQGFSVERGIGGIETAFLARYGSGHPVIGFLGEYDALPGLNQKADVDHEDPMQPGCPGHGCGHNLLGTGALQAACGLKALMEQEKIPGTLIYYGCPAEESGAGKAFMVREGCFEEADFALAWHPESRNGIMNFALANARVLFRFSGKSAHAAAAPWDGRSALDACELMSVGSNYLREHIRPEARIHYAYLNSGGTAPNIVPHHAEVLYALRAPKASYVKELIERVSDIARGAALMTGTKVDIRIVSAYADILDVPEMDLLLMDCLKKVLPNHYTEEEKAYAAGFQKSGTRPDAPEPILTDIVPLGAPMSSGSTDVGDVSWQCPTGSVYMATMAVGTVMHSWSVVAQGKSSIAHKGMHAAAQVLALAAFHILTDKDTQERIRKSFEESKGTQVYETVIPPDTKPGEF